MIIWNQRITNTLTNERDQATEKITVLEKSINKANDTILFIKDERDSLKTVNKNLSNKQNTLLYSLKRKEQELATIKGSFKNHSDEQLVSEANKRANVSDTVRRTIHLSRPTTEFFLETAKEVDICKEQLRISLALNSTYAEIITNDSLIFESYDSEIALKDQIINLRTEQLTISQDSYTRFKRKSDRRDKIKNIIILTLGGYIIGNSVFNR